MRWRRPAGLAEPPLSARMWRDLQRAACPSCKAGLWPRIAGKHLGIIECTATHLDPLHGRELFERAVILEFFDAWSPMTLAAIIQVCDAEYWQARPTTLSDTEYDLVVRRLTQLAPDHPQLQRIGR